MTNLRDLLFGYEESTSIVPQEFVVYNTNKDGSNGGCCYLWTVPTGVTFAVFEIWSGGGSGGCGRCCQQGSGAGGGGYAIKTCTVSAGQQIRICAAGSGCCSGSCTGICGCCSFVCSLGGGGQSTWLSSVDGGRCVSAATSCRYFQSCYSCCSMCFCCGGISSNADFNIPGTVGGSEPTQYCYGEGVQFSSSAPMTAPGPHIGPNGCCGYGGSNAKGIWPGGGGRNAQVFGNVCCCGGPGAGGMVYVLYY